MSSRNVVNRPFVKDIFMDYVSKYNAQDPKIQLKIEHTLKVATISDQIARSLNLSEDEIDLAWLIGMLHDIGRFEQLRKYGTFSDADSVDHAVLGCQILFDDNMIRNFMAINVYDDIIEKAISNHNVYKIEDGLCETDMMYAQIIRDADKVDIFRVASEIPLEDIYNVSAEDIENAQVSEGVMKAFKEHHAVLRSLKKTSVDHIVGHAALAFELVYPESYTIMKEQGFLDKLLSYESKNQKTKAQFVELREDMKNYL